MSNTIIITFVTIFLLTCLAFFSFTLPSQKWEQNYGKRKFLAIIISLITWFVGHEVLAEKRERKTEQPDPDKSNDQKTNGTQSSTDHQQPTTTNSDNDKTSQKKKR